MPTNSEKTLPTLTLHETQHIATMLSSFNQKAELLLKNNKQTQAFLQKEGYAADRESFEVGCDIFSELLEASNSLEEFLANLDAALKETGRRFKQNLKVVMKTARPLEKRILTVAPFFANATDSGKVDNPVFFYNVDESRFYNPANPTVTPFRDFVIRDLNKRFWAHDVTNSPSLMTYVGEVDKETVTKLATVAQDTNGIWLLNNPEMDSFEATLEDAQKSDFGGTDAKYGYVAMYGTPLIARPSYSGDDYTEEEALTVPPSAAMLGAMVRSLPSELTAGWKKGMVFGVTSVTYDSDRMDAALAADSGFNLLAYVKGIVRAFGGRTLNRSNNKALKYINKVRAQNLVSKSLVQFCNEVCFENLTPAKKEALRKQLCVFFNTMKGEGIIKEYEGNKIEVVEVGDEVNIVVPVAFFDPAVFFQITLVSVEDDQKGINQVTKASINKR